ncbi:hypothetical protein VTN02DRAFT_911 [Thermoascus thermophilus]
MKGAGRKGDAQVPPPKDLVKPSRDPPDGPAAGPRTWSENDERRKKHTDHGGPRPPRPPMPRRKKEVDPFIRPKRR